MPRSSDILGYFIVLACAACVVLMSCGKQQSRSIANEPLSVKVFMAEKNSPDWLKRAAAFHQLKQSPQLLSRSEIKPALFELLAKENDLVDETLRKSQGEEGVSVVYGEGYSEYYSDLFDTVDAIGNGDAAALSALAEGAYDPESLFARRLAGKGEKVVPLLVRLAGSESSPSKRAQTMPVLAAIASDHNVSLSSSSAEQIKAVLMQGTSDNDETVRIAAVQSLGRVGGEDIRVLLASVARQDPAKDDTAHFPVRAEARIALAKMSRVIPLDQRTTSGNPVPALPTLRVIATLHHEAGECQMVSKHYQYLIPDFSELDLDFNGSSPGLEIIAVNQSGNAGFTNIVRSGKTLGFDVLAHGTGHQMPLFGQNCLGGTPAFTDIVVKAHYK